MCGIYAVMQKNKAVEKVFQGLKRIEYRGYDSWGIAATQGTQIGLSKQVGQIGSVTDASKIEHEVKKTDAAILAAIGHTRWATHGGVTEQNAHPHQSSDGSFAIVHNGVVENFHALKQDLAANGHMFQTQTDTEVIVRLIEQEIAVNQSSNKKSLASNLTESLERAVQKIEGRNAVVLLTNTSDILVYRKGSPLLIGKKNADLADSADSKEAIFISSDLAALAIDADMFAPLEENRVYLFAGGASESVISQIEFKPIPEIAQQQDLSGHDHFMQKEIAEQPEVYGRLINEDQDQNWADFAALIKKSPHIWLVGAGSSYLAAGQTSWYLKNAGVTCTAVPAYEADVHTQFVKPGDVVVVFSQSGETADTIVVVSEWQKRGAIVVSVVNVESSTLAMQSQIVFPLRVGPEIGVASTKALTAQCVWGWIASQVITQKNDQAVQKIKQFQGELEEWLESAVLSSQLKKVTKYLSNFSSIFILGSGRSYFVALESALKLKEISYIHAEAFSSGELKHGVIALLEQGTPVLFVPAGKAGTAASETKARGAKNIGICAENNPDFDFWIQTPQSEFQDIFQIIVAQKLTYQLSVLKGLNPDKPRNLAKSVTVL
jgi:glucosamine--fructose-6-phosphate aminotransferase (isomerizing)